MCQLRAAPYSYDLVDNLGRRSPQALTPGLERLAPGQTVQRIFRLVSFTDGEQLTIRTHGAFGEMVCTYRVAADPGRAGGSRLVVKVLTRYASSPAGRALRAVLAPGDLVMMRRQLLNLRRLAERTARAA